MSSPETKLWPRDPPSLLSLVIPVCNEEETLPLLRQRLEQLATKVHGKVEMVFIDDGSRDESLSLLREWARVDLRVRVLELARNFGHQAAVTAGLDQARGDAIVIMDGDLQDPPELVLEMVVKYCQGWDVVYAKRRTRVGETLFKRASASAFYWLMRTFVHSEMPLDVGDFRLMTAEANAALAQLREGHRFLRGMVAWLGFCQTEVLFDRPARIAGRTKFSFVRMTRFAWDAMLSFSSSPLRLGIYAGAMVFVLGFAMGSYSLVRKLLGYPLVPGWTTLVVLQCVIGGGILVAQGFIGEYVGRIYDELKRRPLYIVRRRYNIERTTGRVERAVVGTAVSGAASPSERPGS